MAEQLSLAEWKVKAEKAYKKGVYTAADMVRDWGYPKEVDPTKFRMLFRSGKAGTKSREAINASKAKSNKGRTVKETYSTDLAGAERRAQDRRFQPVLDEASLFALNDKQFAMMIEHGTALNVFDAVDSPDASGDPTNRYLQPVTEGISKTDYENYLKSQGLEKDLVIMQDEITGGFRGVDSKKANTYQFPSEQGKPINSLDDLKKLVQQTKQNPIQNVDGGIRFQRRAAMAAAAGGALAPAFLGTAASASELQMRTKIAEQTKNPLDRVQQGIAGTSLALDAASYIPVAAVPAGIASAGLDVVNVGFDTGRELVRYLGGIFFKNK